MTSIITGDLIHSRKMASHVWMEGLQALLASKGKSPQSWEIYRGDAFQLEIPDPEASLLTALEIKAYLKTMKLDARMAIGIGEKTFDPGRISQSNGPAFIRSGELFETLKKQKTTLAVRTDDENLDQEINLMLRLGLVFLNQWLPQSAEFFLLAIRNPLLSQEEIGNKLGITQAAVSRRRKRAQFEVTMELEAFYRQKIKTLIK